MKKLLCLLSVAMLSLAVYAGEVAEITIPELKAAIAAKKVTLLDANGTDSWKEGHIPGAIDFATAKKNLASVLPKDKSALVVAYCGGPACGAYASAAKAAEKLGYTNVKHLKAGISGWESGHEKMEAGK